MPVKALPIGFAAPREGRRRLVSAHCALSTSQDLFGLGELHLHDPADGRAWRDDVSGLSHLSAGLPIDDFPIRQFARLPMDNGHRQRNADCRGYGDKAVPARTRARCGSET